MFNILGKRIKPPIQERLSKIEKNLKPSRKNPDFTNPLANQKLSEIVGRTLPYNLGNWTDVDNLFCSLHNLPLSQKSKLTEFISPESDCFKLFIKKIKLLKPSFSDYYEVTLGLDRKPRNINKIEFKIYQNLTLYFNSTTKILEICMFYPAGATIRGYSIGSKILREIERLAKVLKVKEIVVSDPTTDAMIFYQKMGFNIEIINQKGEITKLKKII